MMLKIIEQMKPHCKSKEHTVSCACYVAAEKEFLKRASKNTNSPAHYNHLINVLKFVIFLR